VPDERPQEKRGREEIRVSIAQACGSLEDTRPMSRKARRVLVVTVAATAVVAMLLIDGLFGLAQALGEYFRPTTVEAMFQRQGCIETNEAPPPDLMRIVENQGNLYHLALQKVAVCRAAHRSPELERRFAGLPFAFAEGSPWRPLSKGCCSAQFRRHVIVEVADSRENGSVVVEAALIQSRWDYLRLKWNALRGSWVWRWCRSGIETLVLVIRRNVSEGLYSLG
jgi:hypothetical protein